MNTALTLWSKIPALVRAPVTAMLVLMAAVYPTRKTQHVRSSLP